MLKLEIPSVTERQESRLFTYFTDYISDTIVRNLKFVIYNTTCEKNVLKKNITNPGVNKCIGSMTGRQRCEKRNKTIIYSYKNN